jgi:ATP synthase protein I
MVRATLEGVPEKGRLATEGASAMKEPRETRRQKAGIPGVTDDLASRIASAKRERADELEQTARRSSGDTGNLGRGVRLGSEFIAAILVGVALGYGFDLLTGTQPWGMLVMLLVGFAAGILNVTRAVGEMNRASPPPPGSDLGEDADKEDED